VARVAGVDGCKAGWIAAIDEGTAVRFKVFADFSGLAQALADCAIIAVDMPMGLPDRVTGPGRGPEQAVRPLLGARQSSVFSVPGRAAIYAVVPQPQGMAALKAGHQIASQTAKALSDPPRGVAFQTFNIFAKIRDVDQFLNSHPERIAQIREVHPEVAFWRMNGCTPLRHPKKIKGVVNPAGMEERRHLLRASGMQAEAVSALPPKGAATDDLLDSLAGLVAARQIAAGRGRSHPEWPAQDANGVPIAIWTWE
jgi:threonine dehydratase